MNREPYAIYAEQLSWHHQGNHILSDISFSLEQGKILGVIGPNGAGKSSLLRCLYRYITPTFGSIEILGQSMKSWSANHFAKQVAVVLQDTPHHFDMTVTQLVALGLTPHKSVFSLMNKQEQLQIVEALAKVGLTEFAHHPYEQLSGGEKQRALIARALVQLSTVQQSQLLILDEPTNHLDIRYQVQILALLRSLGITVVVSIHDLNLASAMCDQLLLLNQGEVVAQGSPIEVLTETQIKQVFGVDCRVSLQLVEGLLLERPQITYLYNQQVINGEVNDHG